jgi:hypothetical protein
LVKKKKKKEEKKNNNNNNKTTYILETYSVSIIKCESETYSFGFTGASFIFAPEKKNYFPKCYVSLTHIKMMAMSNTHAEILLQLFRKSRDYKVQYFEQMDCMNK